MIFTKREKTIGIVVVAGVTLFALDYFFFEPYVLTPRTKVERSLADLNAESRKNELVFGKKRVDQATRKKLEDEGMADKSESEAILEHAMNKLVGDSGVKLMSRTTERPLSLDSDAFSEGKLQFQAKGTAAQVERLVSRIESMAWPIRLTYLHITGEGLDDLTVEIRISTLGTNPDVDKPKAQQPRAGA